MLHEASDFVLGIGWLGEIEVLPNEEQEVPKVSSQRAGGQFMGVVQLDVGLSDKGDLDMDRERRDELDAFEQQYIEEDLAPIATRWDAEDQDKATRYRIHKTARDIGDVALAALENNYLIDAVKDAERNGNLMIAGHEGLLFSVMETLYYDYGAKMAEESIRKVQSVALEHYKSIGAAVKGIENRVDELGREIEELERLSHDLVSRSQSIKELIETGALSGKKSIEALELLREDRRKCGEMLKKLKIENAAVKELWAQSKGAFQSHREQYRIEQFIKDAERLEGSLRNLEVN